MSSSLPLVIRHHAGVRLLSRFFFSLGLAAFALAACSDTGEPPPRVSTVEVSPGTPIVIVGETVQLSATARSAAGVALFNRPTTWTTENPFTATVSPTGLVTGVATGPVTVTVTVEGVSRSVTVTVAPVPVATVVVTPAVDTLEQVQTLQLSASLRSATGAALADRLISWSTSNSTVAVVSDVGLVTALGVGSATITATSEGRAGSATIHVTPSAAAPTITSVSPATLVPGSTATVVGTNLPLTVAQASVTLGGVAASVISSSATQVQFTVPCVNTGTHALIVSASSLQSVPRNQPVQGAPISLAVGEAAILSEPAQLNCPEIAFGATAGRYVTTVYSIATAAGTLSDFKLLGNVPASGSAVAVYASASARVPDPMTPAEQVEAERDRAHTARLAENKRILEQLMPRARSRGEAASVVYRELPTVGQMRRFSFRYSGGCVTPTDFIDARAVYVGSKAIVWEDTSNVVLTTNSALYATQLQRIGTKYDTEQHDVIATNFGDPLRRDLDGDGRVHMIFTRRVNGIAAAFVTGCDQFSTVEAPSSNVGEFFYGFVPTSPTPDLNSTASPDGWAAFMMRTVVHEVKHIASLSARVANAAAGWEQGWLEEGTARHAEELWYRASTAPAAWKSNIGWGSAVSNGVYCDFHLFDATCNANTAHRPSWGVRRQFAELRPRLREPWNWSPFGDGSGQSGSVFYQVSWHLVRYAVDRYGSSEPDFLGGLTQASASGVTNLAGQSGVTLARLLGAWGLAMYLDDYPGLASPSQDITLPTWNTRSIYAGVSASPSWNSQFDTPFLLQPNVISPGAFSATQLGVRGGGHVYYEFAGIPNGYQALRLRAPDGGPPSANLRMAIARIQ